MALALESWRARSREMRHERFSARVFEAGGGLDARRCAEVRHALDTYGGVHVRETGLASLADVQAVLPLLGFDEASRFTAGGRASATTQEKWVAPGLRRLDYYPPDLYLLPNNEVQYRRCTPRRVLFAVLGVPDEGGRVFLHAAADVEAALRRELPELLARIHQHGLGIETGFLSKTNPAQASNYFQSWQERFGTDDPAEALARARAQRDEYDECWWRDDTLMTRITLSAAWPDEHGERFLRFPRLALDAPAPHNGFRRFPLGDGSELTASEVDAVRSLFLSTRQGVPLSRGDLVLFDNLRFGHSREAFRGTREVVVAMAGEAWDPRVRTPAAVATAFGERPSLTHHGRYRLPDALVDPARRFTARVFDAGGALTATTTEAITRELAADGAVHVQHTGLLVDDAGALPDEVLRALGFGGDDAFRWGGLASGRTMRRALSPELRATDAYPAHLWLLPHNEVLYQRDVPRRLLFFSSKTLETSTGGRTFVHDAKRLEQFLRRQRGGEALLASLRQHGQRIEMGFVDERHPRRRLNFFRSWQERFGTDDADEAEARCRAATHQFDECWWRDDDGTRTLMTRFRVPLFHGEWLLFPRIALDAPAHENGWRCYPKGDGTPFRDDELELLLHGFLETREAVHWRAGDLLLLDNVRFGHSREAYVGPRTLGVAMAGTVRLDP